MGNPYKLSEEIEQFILQQKRLNPKLSCRSLIPLVKQRFQVTLSKSLINRIIKANNLSNPAGRAREKKQISAVILPQPFPDQGVMENGGYFFLKAADLKLSLVSSLAEQFLVYFPNFSPQNLKKIIETSFFSSFFKSKRSLFLFIGAEVAQVSLNQYTQKMAQIPLEEVKIKLKRVGLNHNINGINELRKSYLLKLNSYVQVNFFPQIYKILDFPALHERFYKLTAKIEKRTNLFTIQTCYPSSFTWALDVVWQEDFAIGAERVNAAAIFNPEGLQIWITPKPILQEVKTVTFL